VTNASSGGRGFESRRPTTNLMARAFCRLSNRARQCVLPDSTVAGRANGLDTLRATAIALVFMYHYMVFVSDQPTFGWASEVGWAGVDLFFVLSGYLIANQIFAGLTKGRRVSLKFFYIRRAMRTWPAFWVVLAVYFIFPNQVGGDTLLPLWKYLTFTQNFGLHGGTSFSHAWSLCIEEQFYFVLPILVLAGVWDAKPKAWALMSILLGVGIASRTVLWFSHGQLKGGYYPYIYYATLCRFDEFLPGIAVAMIKSFYPSTWDALTKRGHSILAVGLIITAVMLVLADRLYLVKGYGYGLFMTSVGFSMLAIAFSVLIIAALSPSSWLHRVRIPGAYHVALWSYSEYLSHKAIATFVKQQFVRWDLPQAWMLAAITMACLLAGWMLSSVVEAPFMRLRNRLAPTIFSAAPGLLPKTEPSRAASMR
jgi:peptidoglycan/LPS O-acetylase OafA/YrhL